VLVLLLQWGLPQLHLDLLVQLLLLVLLLLAQLLL
jgi:hypothetical protein